MCLSTIVLADISSGLPWQDWKVLLAEGWNNASTPQQRQAHAATQQTDDVGRTAERGRQQAEAQLESDHIFRSQVSTLCVVQVSNDDTSRPLLGLLLSCFRTFIRIRCCSACLMPACHEPVAVSCRQVAESSRLQMSPGTALQHA